MSDYPEFYTHIKRRARKDHKCCECHGIIHTSEFYHYMSGLWDGDVRSHKRCVDCETLANEISEGRDLEELTWITGLLEDCANTGDEWLAKIEAIMRKRGADIKPWIAERLKRDEQ